MIFTFLMIGMLLHKTPARYVISMKRSSSNISGILFQYPFYAGIMGIMLYTGLGDRLGEMMASMATLETYPFFAYLIGGIVNFAIPSAGGEFGRNRSQFNKCDYRNWHSAYPKKKLQQ